MKITLLTIYVILFSLAGISQSLEGRWKGYYTSEYRPIGYTDRIEKSEIPINLEFRHNSDGSYLVYSHTILNGMYKRDTVTCMMSSVIQGDSVFLQEIQTVDPKNNDAPKFQKMKLKLLKNKKHLRMEGKWEVMSTGDSGIVSFIKRD